MRKPPLLFISSSAVQYKTLIPPLSHSPSLFFPFPSAMRSFIRTFTRRRPLKPASPTTSRTENRIVVRAMSTSMTAAVLYACSMSSPKALGAVPEDSASKAHHAKDGKGFVNPWPSWVDFNPFAIGGAMIWYLCSFPLPSLDCSLFFISAC